jgi:hypothetical protein
MEDHPKKEIPRIDPISKSIYIEPRHPKMKLIGPNDVKQAVTYEVLLNGQLVIVDGIHFYIKQGRFHSFIYS